MKRVFVVGQDHMISNMFQRNDKYGITYVLENADIVCFIGGADVNPELYGQKKLSLSRTSASCDKRDIEYWERSKDTDQVKVGICRGGQFLNVMNGGLMWQDVDRHNRGPHKIQDLYLKKEGDLFRPEITVTSTHHQMMRAAPTGHVLAVAHLATYKTDDTWTGPIIREGYPGEEFDTEVVWYPGTKSLCFQPHPEYHSGENETADYFFELLEELS